MIEHFKKFDTDKKKLLPLSFSHLNEFAFNRERWALRRIFGYEFPSSASAERGTAVETALNMIMTGADYETAKAKMKILDKCGIEVARSVADIGSTMKKEIDKRGKL